MAEIDLPLLVADRVLGNRAHFHALDAKAREAQKDLPPEAPRFGYVTKALSLDRERQFWQIEDDDALEDFLFEDLLPALYGNLTEDEWQSLPPGYAPLVTVLEFERHCMFEGWGAVSNKGNEEMPYVVESYRELGLEQEAEALEQVFLAYSLHAGDEDDGYHDRLGEAYRSVPNDCPEMEDRVPLLLKYVRAHPELFSVSRQA